MRTLSLTAAATRAHVAPKTIKAWHSAELISALSVGRRGVSWLFDEATFDREVAELPRCSYRRVDEAAGLTVRCSRPVGEGGAACKRHSAALAVANEDQAARQARISRSAATRRRYEDGARCCEAEGCTNELREQNGWRLERRRRELARSRKDGDTRLLCGPCASRRRHREKPYSKGRLRLCPSCGEGPDWWQPWQEERFTHCARCFRSAPDVRDQRRETRLAYLATAEGVAAHEIALSSAQALQVASTAALPLEGLVPAKHGAAMAAPFLNYSPSTVVQALRSQGKTQRREPNGLARDGVSVADLLSLEINGARLSADDKRKLGGQLNKVESARKGTEFGKPTIDKHRPGTSARILELHRERMSVRKIAAEVGVSKSHVANVIAPHRGAVQIP